MAGNKIEPGGNVMEHRTREPLKATLQDVQHFAENDNSFHPVNNLEILCGDDRYPFNNGGISAFGAHGRYYIALEVLNTRYNWGKSPAQLADIAIETAVAIGGTFILHTDDKTPQDDPEKTGCGYIAKAADPYNAHRYAPVGIKAERIQQGLAHINTRATQESDTIRIDILTGPHNPNGVIIDEGEEETISHQDKTLKFFTKTPKREKRYLKEKVVPQLRKLLPEIDEDGITVEEMEYILDKLDDITAEQLAKGLPAFSVDSNRNVQELGVI